MEQAKTFEIIVEIIIVGVSVKQRRQGGQGYILTAHPCQPPTLCFCEHVGKITISVPLLRLKTQEVFYSATFTELNL